MKLSRMRGCFTLWSLCGLGVMVVFSISSISDLPVANDQILVITALYADAGRALDSLIGEASWLPATPERQHVINRLTAHSNILRTLEKADRLRAKFVAGRSCGQW